MKGVASRKIVVEVLLKVELEGAYANLALAAAFKKNSISERDRAFVTHIVQGVLRHEKSLDIIIGKLSTRPVEKIQPALKMVLRMGLYQLIYMTDLPESAVIDTACEVAGATGHKGSTGFANAVLRSYLRRKDELQPASEPDENAGVGALASFYSCPEWLVQRWFDRYGRSECKLLLEHSQSVPELVLRVSTVSITPEGLESIFQSKGIKFRKGELVPSCLIIEDRGDAQGAVEKLPGFAEGLFAIQDEAAAFVSTVINPGAGQVIVDLCAAPGGKSLHLGDLLEGKGKVLAVDIHENRLKLMVKERRRLGLTNIELAAGDGTSWQPQSKVDAVLVDAPCMGTGVLNRRSDLRKKKESPDISSLSQIQYKLLENAAEMLKPGGILVYSTCSIEPEENEELVSAFLASHVDFQADSLLPYIPQTVVSRWSQHSWWESTRESAENGCLQLLPSRHGTSGFFVARLKRRESPECIV